jgi:hypothetical protein
MLVTSNASEFTSSAVLVVLLSTITQFLYGSTIPGMGYRDPSANCSIKKTSEQG